MTVPTEYPRRSESNWKKTHDGDAAKVWQNGQGDVVTFTQSFNQTTENWEVADTTNTAVKEKAVGPFESYIDALEYVNTFIPRLGRDELPDEVVKVPDDEVVKIGSYPSGATDRECNECEQSVFTSYRVEYGDESHEWLCVLCAKDRFGWTTEKEPTIGFNVNGSGEEGYEAIKAAQTALEGHAEALISGGVVDVNGVASALQNLGRYKFENKRESFDDKSSAYGFKRDVHKLIIEYREENPDIKWHEIRDAFTDLRQYAHEYAREEVGESTGRREVLNEIQESGMTPNEWFEQNVDLEK